MILQRSADCRATNADGFIEATELIFMGLRGFVWVENCISG